MTYIVYINNKIVHQNITTLAFFEHIFMDILSVLCKTYWNFISTVVRLDYHDYIGEVWNKSENVHSN